MILMRGASTGRAVDPCAVKVDFEAESWMEMNQPCSDPSVAEIQEGICLARRFRFTPGSACFKGILACHVCVVVSFHSQSLWSHRGDSRGGRRLNEVRFDPRRLIPSCSLVYFCAEMGSCLSPSQQPQDIFTSYALSHQFANLTVVSVFTTRVASQQTIENGQYRRLGKPSHTHHLGCAEQHCMIV